MKRHQLVLAAVCLALSQITQAAGLQWYTAGDWAGLRHEHSATPWVVHFWGMTCAPCRKELPEWSLFMREHPELKITFIQVEQAEPSDIETVLAKAGLSETDQRTSPQGFDVEERFEIDKRWGGETPMTLLFSPDGSVQKITGIMNFERLARWAGTGSGH